MVNSKLPWVVVFGVIIGAIVIFAVSSNFANNSTLTGYVSDDVLQDDIGVIEDDIDKNDTNLSKIDTINDNPFGDDPLG